MPSIVAVQAVSGVSAAAPTSAAMTATNTAVEDARATASSVQPFFPFSAPSHESDGFKSTEELVIWVEAAKNASDSSHGLAQGMLILALSVARIPADHNLPSSPKPNPIHLSDIVQPLQHRLWLPTIISSGR